MFPNELHPVYKSLSNFELIYYSTECKQYKIVLIYNGQLAKKYLKI